MARRTMPQALPMLQASEVGELTKSRKPKGAAAKASSPGGKVVPSPVNKQGASLEGKLVGSLEGKHEEESSFEPFRRFFATLFCKPEQHVPVPPVIQQVSCTELLAHTPCSVCAILLRVWYRCSTRRVFALCTGWSAVTRDCSLYSLLRRWSCRRWLGLPMPRLNRMYLWRARLPALRLPRNPCSCLRVPKSPSSQ